MSVQKFDHVSDKRLITGTSGTGKTTIFADMVKGERARWKFVFDHQGEFARRFDVPAVFDVDGLCAAVEKTGWVCFDPVRLYPGRSTEAFAFYCDFVMAVAEKVKGRKIFACDELQKLTGTRREPIEFLAMLDTGRRFQVDVIAISQSPNRIHNGIRNQLTKVFTFRQSDANAITYLAENGFDADKIRALQRGEYLWRNLDSGDAGAGGKAF